ncbi:hypothetical protein VSP10_13555 [Myroides odoratimimus]|uniref:MutS-related protein n=1 Tax=Myroides odoratimimus TaxID=76832 RepID=UPI002DB8251B|nr:hypothetical protein [Myroides odoratimimus]MEC4053812.1 hypothetical protein [Myroides odoratimimus]
MNWILGAFILLILYILFDKKRNRNKRNAQLRKLKESWGHPKGLTDFNFDKIASYHHALGHNTSYQTISKTINQDLDLDDTFTYLDRTHSLIGQQYLYHKLHTIKSPEEVRDLDQTINFFKTNSDERIKVQMLLSTLTNRSIYYYHTLFTHNITINRSKLKLAYVLNIITISSLLLSLHSLIWILVLLPVFSVNLVLHYKNKYAQYDQLSATQNFKHILSSTSQLLKMQKLSTAYNFTETKKAIPTLRKLNTLTYFFTSDSAIKDEITTLVMFPIELLKIMLNIEVITFESFLLRAQHAKEELKISFETIAKIDTAISIASLQTNNRLCQPVFHNSKEIQIENLIHPLIENCVSNTIHLENKSLLLTGSNMAGKTTFIRALTLNTILAQTIGYVFATSYKANFYQINSSIRITDDLHNDTSYYLQEVKQIKHFIVQSNTTDPQLYVLDEILKGTNTKERISAAYAILTYLNKEKDIVIVSTHDIELIELLEKEGYQCQYLQESIVNNELHFDYKLKLGQPQTTNAIKILELNDFPTEITDLAYNTKKMFS